MRKVIFILTLLPSILLAQDFNIGDNALVHIASDANLELGGNLVNRGALQNLGTLSLYGDWKTNNNFNGSAGKLFFLGAGNQSIVPPSLTVSEMTINSGGNVNFTGQEYIVTDRIDFQFGNIEIGEGTRFVLEENVRVIGGSSSSFIDGKVIFRGSGIKKFPVGNNGVYGPLTLLDVFGVDTEISVSYDDIHPIDPLPADTLLGVSDIGLWEVELIQGTTDATIVNLEFNDHDLGNFKRSNKIRHKVNTPVITYSNRIGGEFGSLGVSELLDTDSVTYGTITAEVPVNYSIGQKLYFALGLAPKVPNERLLFIPQAFSPNATDPDNQAFKIFGESISDEDFSLQVFNRLGVLVFTTTSFNEANKRGWDGTNQSTGADEPTGLYYYAIRLKYTTGLIFEDTGAFYLVK